MTSVLSGSTKTCALFRTCLFIRWMLSVTTTSLQLDDYYSANFVFVVRYYGYLVFARFMVLLAAGWLSQHSALSDLSANFGFRGFLFWFLVWFVVSNRNHDEIRNRFFLLLYYYNYIFQCCVWGTVMFYVLMVGWGLWSLLPSAVTKCCSLFEMYSPFCIWHGSRFFFLRLLVLDGIYMCSSELYLVANHQAIRRYGVRNWG